MARPTLYKFNIKQLEKHISDDKSATWMSKNVCGCSPATVSAFLRKHGYYYTLVKGWRKDG